jgi:hypothetical protein
MAKKPASACSCVIDTSGLHGIATASANLQSALLARLADGTIGVPTWAWQELQETYPEDAAVLSGHIVKRFQYNAKIYARAAQITEAAGLGLSLGAYDQHVERYTAAAAHIHGGLTVLTSADNLDMYSGLGCTATDLVAWVEAQG